MSKYREASHILELSTPNHKNIKNHVFRSSYHNKMELYAIVKETLKNDTILSKIIQISQINKKSNYLKNIYLCKVLIYDLLIGYGINSTERKFVKPFINELKSIYNSLKTEFEIPNKITQTKNIYPRFVRFNTLSKSIEQIIDELNKKGFVLKEFQCNTYKKFLKYIQNLTSTEFAKDIHVDNLFVFSSENKLHFLDLYKNGSIILQDKASCIPAIVLNAKIGSHVIDACAAPGNKTTHVAALLNNKGKIFAFDRDQNRLEIMKVMLKKASAICVKPIKGDFLKSQPTNLMFSKVKYILVDPSCSGSGILDRIDEEKNEEYESRLNKLSKVQAMLLKHALSFPFVNRVVYSTCSLNHQENEGVVMEALQKYSQTFQLISVFQELPNRGDTKIFCDADKCLYMRPEIDRTNGFFVACFERIKNCNIPKSNDPINKITNLDNFKENKSLIHNQKCNKNIKKKKNKLFKDSYILKSSKENTEKKHSRIFNSKGLLKKKKINKNKLPITKNI